MVEDDLIHWGDTITIGVGQPLHFGNLAPGADDPRVIGGVTGHSHQDAILVSMCLGFERAEMPGAAWGDRDAQLFVDFPDQCLDVGFAGFAFPAGQVEDVLAVRTGAQDGALFEVDPGDLVYEAHDRIISRRDDTRRRVRERWL